MKHTVEEVRKSADWLYQWERKAGARNARAMLIAFAERIEADEVAVPAATSCADHAKGETGYCTFHTNVPWGTKLFTHPPAQAGQSVDAFADRLRQSIMRDTFQPTADPVAQGEPVAGIQVPREGMPRVAQFIPYPAWLRMPPGIHDLFTTPPAQPAQSVDIGAIREVIESHINEAKKLRHDPESQDYLYEQADKLEAAIRGEPS